MPYANRQTLLSRGEMAFHGPLLEAVAGKYLVMCKVRLADIITCSQTNWYQGWGGAIAQKHIDFVLCDPVTTRFILAIELDDRSHERPDRRRRDAFVNQVMADAAVRLIRFQARAHYCVPTLTDALGNALSTEVSSPTSTKNRSGYGHHVMDPGAAVKSGFECRERPPDSGPIRQVGMNKRGLQVCRTSAVLVGDPRLRAPTTTAEYGRRKQPESGADEAHRTESSFRQRFVRHTI